MFNMADDSRKVDTPFAAGIDPCQQSPSNVIYPYRQEKKPSFQGNDNETGSPFCDLDQKKTK
ncbi:hypothetical protein DERF_012276 [Dermatophagoides farinae]|uniref:Uncharacterized protein n=1 Tax=Dermatophagoides farinae TaxID=6954 RepID=A0A922HRM9_DERFA|nr:hypothetical protein DERF_012276 [Dermatophagoides farinae]